ncbi:hypothetical protein OIV19_17465 [Brucella sp. HL-2]|nr:hypothetical protein [Brucella sp. HL-2]MCV9909389.1 hypothetical protein [Brucella sp. HL-2]
MAARLAIAFQFGETRKRYGILDRFSSCLPVIFRREWLPNAFYGINNDRMTFGAMIFLGFYVVNLAVSLWSIQRFLFHCEFPRMFNAAS